MELEEAREEARRRAAKEAIDQVDDLYEQVLCEGPVDSPIERLFLAAFSSVRQVDPLSWTIQAQVPVGQYRVDFMVSFSVGGVTERVVVECDGHDFHEKTREQAERDKRRDRDIAAFGFQTLRFTGRELFRDPFECADEVADLLSEKAFSRHRELIAARAGEGQA